MRYIGIDLAWSDRNPSGLVVIDDAGEVKASAYLTDLDAIAGFCLAHATEESALVAVDAPLAVPNERGHREADRALMRLFGGRRLGAHVASRSRLTEVHGGLRGEALLARLGGAFERIIEVYPHAALMAWFDLPAPLAYKRGSLARRLEGLQRLVELLRRLGQADPPLAVDSAPWLVGHEDGRLTGAGVEQLESLLDALVCAYVASYCRRWGPERCVQLGDGRPPYLVTPLPPRRRAPGSATEGSNGAGDGEAPRAPAGEPGGRPGEGRDGCDDAV